MQVDKRFFESTRGQIVTMLRASPCTVEELARNLDLTDNAIRAHLLTLERDGIVRQSGVRRGPRKPHFTYTLTPQADSLFPKAYDALLNQLIFVLKNRLNPAEIEEVLREVGRAIASGAPREWPEPVPRAVARGEEIARFNMGSTVVVLLGTSAFELVADACDGLAVRMGQALGTFTRG